METQIIEHGSESQPLQISTGARVLFAEDEPVTSRMIERQLTSAGYSVVSSRDGLEALEKINEDTAVAILDLRMPRMGGMEALIAMRERFPGTQVIILSAEADAGEVVAAMRAGAFWYLRKPVDRGELLAIIEKAISHGALARANTELRGAMQAPRADRLMVARSPITKALYDQLTKIAATDSSVLITGESGTGKTTLARYIHEQSDRRAGPFVSVSCAAIPRELLEAELFGHERGAFTGAVAARPGRAELADGGTLFLDEVGELPLELQAKLLTFLQDHTVQRIGSNKARRLNVRVVAATLQDLGELRRQRKFREDLYYRLNVLSLRVAPLRERLDDLPQLIEAQLKRISDRRGAPAPTVSTEALFMLLRHPWPGNIRELENVLERAATFCSGNRIEPADLILEEGSMRALPASANIERPTAQLAGMTLEEIEKLALLETLRACDGSRAKAARMLGISERSIYNMIKRHAANDLTSPPKGNQSNRTDF